MTFKPSIKEIEESYFDVLKNLKAIDDQLDKNNIGRKDTPFDKNLMENLLSAWDMLEINNRVHYGLDDTLRQEYHKVISATAEKFTKQVQSLRNYYRKKRQISLRFIKLQLKSIYRFWISPNSISREITEVAQ